MKKLKKNFFLSGLFLLSFSFQNLASAKIETIIGTSLERNSNLPIKVPETRASEIILSRDQYIISYNKNRRSANWVAWKLEADQMGSSGRTNNFSVDNELENYLSETSAEKHAVEASEYKGSCFDRGHQIPSADRTDTKENNETTFLMSNMLPQTSYLNRITWEHLEQYSRDLVKKEGKKLYIISGPIYDQDFGFIGPQKDIPVPSKNFKIIFVLDSNQLLNQISTNTQMIAVVIPNALQDGSAPNENMQDLCAPLNTGSSDKKDWERYTTTIKEIENLSGLKFSSLKM